jgi:hypothetical protein
MRITAVVMTALFTVLLVGVAALGCSSRTRSQCPEDAVCTQMGCPAATGVVGPSAWEVGLALPVESTAVSDLAGSTVSGCRNDDCSSGTLGDPPELNTRGSYSMAAGNVYLGADLYRPVNGPPVLEVGWGRQTVNDLPDPQDGDAYSVELRTAAGAVVAAASGTAKYTVTYPNGQCCEPACLSGKLTMTPDGGAAR